MDDREHRVCATRDAAGDKKHPAFGDIALSARSVAADAYVSFRPFAPNWRDYNPEWSRIMMLICIPLKHGFGPEPMHDIDRSMRGGCYSDPASREGDSPANHPRPGTVA